MITGPENRRHRNGKNFLKASATFVFFAIFIASASAQAWSAFQAAANKDRQLAPDIFEQVIDTDTSHSAGSVTAAYQEIQKRLLDNDDVRAHGKDEHLPVESFYRGL
jgi:predicted negative regulator of RcsB-dependent stress response